MNASVTESRTSPAFGLRARDIEVRRDGRQILSVDEFHLESGELVGLIGPNGAGKSTLMAVLAGLDGQFDGRVELDGRSLNSIDAPERAQTLGWLEQLGSIHWPVAVERLVMLGRLPWLAHWARPRPADHEAVTRALHDTDCLALAGRDSTALSGGERARVLMARALAAEPRFLLADEPVASLDVAHQLQIMNVLRAFANDERACLVVLHDLALAARFCDRLYLMDEGSVVARGSPDAVLQADILSAVYDVELAMGKDPVPWFAPIAPN